MLKRKAEKEIVQWIENSKKALLVYGVRQSGKTFIIRECLKKSGCSYVEFNLIKQPDVLFILEHATDSDDLILKLSLYSSQPIIPGKTYFFFDEIQMYKEIVTRLKFLVEDGRFRYILSGSLLGIEIVSLKSAPVGYVQSLTMYPLDFEEFLQIFNVTDSVMEQLWNHFLSKTPVDSVIHRRLMDIFNLYLIIGGMPAAVEAYRSSNNIDAVIAEHQAIIEQYKLDFTQYETENRKLILTHIYDMIPAEINEKSKRFNIADIRKDLRYDRISESFTWLLKAGVALGVCNVTEPVIPLLLNEKHSLFKLFLSDVGLLTTAYGKTTKLMIITHNKDINKGAIYENVAAQELYAHGYQMYYYSNKKKGELDFVIEQNERILPIEIKSGKDYEKHSALNNVLSSDEYGINEAYVFTNDNIRTNGKITYFPIYMLMFLKEDNINFADISLERYKL